MPIATTEPFLTHCALSVIPRHTLDMFVVGINMSISQCPLQYLCLRTQDQSEFGSIKVLQPSLVRKSELDCRVDLMLMPPLFLGSCSVSYQIKCILCLSSSPPQTKRRVLLSILSHTVRGNFAVCIEQLAITEMVDLAKVILPARERYFDFHPVRCRSNINVHRSPS